MTPGFVDAHTHMGMSWQELAGEADTNESTSAVNPHLRAIDSVNFHDVAFTDALEGGRHDCGHPAGQADDRRAAHQPGGRPGGRHEDTRRHPPPRSPRRSRRDETGPGHRRRRLPERAQDRPEQPDGHCGAAAEGARGCSPLCKRRARPGFDRSQAGVPRARRLGRAACARTRPRGRRHPDCPAPGRRVRAQAGDPPCDRRPPGHGRDRCGGRPLRGWAYHHRAGDEP